MGTQKSIELLPIAKFIFVLTSQKTKISRNCLWSYGLEASNRQSALHKLGHDGPTPEDLLGRERESLEGVESPVDLRGV